MNLAPKTAIGREASSGIDATISTALIQNGKKVYGFAQNEKTLNAIQKQLGGYFVPVPLDITDLEAVKS